MYPGVPFPGAMGLTCVWCGPGVSGTDSGSDGGVLPRPRAARSTSEGRTDTTPTAGAPRVTVSRLRGRCSQTSLRRTSAGLARVTSGAGMWTWRGGAPSCASDVLRGDASAAESPLSGVSDSPGADMNLLSTAFSSLSGPPAGAEAQWIFPVIPAEEQRAKMAAVSSSERVVATTPSAPPGVRAKMIARDKLICHGPGTLARTHTAPPQ